MHLVEMGPNTKIVCATDLGSRDLDRNHDWINNTRYFSDDIEKACNFVHEAANNGTNNLETDDSVDYENLNEN